MIICKMLVVCQKWKELVISPRVQHWGYSLHVKLEHFFIFAKTNQACKILSKKDSDILIEPYGKPYICWVDEVQYKKIKSSACGILCSGESPKFDEIFNDLGQINNILDRYNNKEKDDSIKEEDIKETGTVASIDDFLKRKQTND